MGTRRDAYLLKPFDPVCLREALTQSWGLPIDQIMYTIEENDIGWHVRVRADDASAPSEVTFARCIALALQQNVVTDLPPKAWANGFWLLAEPTEGKVNFWVVPDEYTDTTPPQETGHVDPRREKWRPLPGVFTE